MSTKIAWREELYQWKKVEPHHFNTEDWIAINGDIQLIRIDPKIAAEHMFVSEGVNFFCDFKLYQCDSPSAIRNKIPVRFFFNRRKGKVYELKGENPPIYDMMQFLINDLDYRNKIKVGKKWYLDHLIKYVILFFDNVQGRHGRFELIHNYAELLNRVKTYDIYSGTSVSPPFSKEQKEFQKLIRDQVLSIPMTIKEVSEKEYVVEHVCMIFKGNLFRSHVIFSAADDSFGTVSLSGDEQISYHWILRDTWSKEVLEKNFVNIERLAVIPEEELD